MGETGLVTDPPASHALARTRYLKLRLMGPNPPSVPANRRFRRLRRPGHATPPNRSSFKRIRVAAPGLNCLGLELGKVAIFASMERVRPDRPMEASASGGMERGGGNQALVKCLCRATFFDALVGRAGDGMPLACRRFLALVCFDILHHATPPISMRLQGVGSYLRARILDASEVDRRAGVQNEGTWQHTGVAQRRQVDHRTTAGMGGSALRSAIVCAEIASMSLDGKHAESAGLRGDGAAVVLIEAGAGDSALLLTWVEAWPEGAATTEVRGGSRKLPPTRHQAGENTDESLFDMQGSFVVRLAAAKMEPLVEHLVGFPGCRGDGIDWGIPHQASLPAIRQLRRRWGIPASKRVETMQHHGNVVSASMLWALPELILSGRLLRGQTGLFLGTLAGLSRAGALGR